MPTDKRKAFTDVWRTNLVVNTSTGKPETKKPIITEFISAGKVFFFNIYLLLLLQVFLILLFNNKKYIAYIINMYANP